MLKSDLNFEYPSHLVATEKKPVSRVMWVQKGDPREVTISHVLSQIEPGDVLVVNESRVIPARIFDPQTGLEILFIKPLEDQVWEILSPIRRWPANKKINLPGNIEVELLQGGLPQQAKVNQPLSSDYFEKYGQMPLPPYIQQARGEREAREQDKKQYQAAWAKELGSLAAPTASLHFSEQDLSKVRARGAEVIKICLHVGLGTFLPIHCDDLNDHKMHKEWVSIGKEAWDQILSCKKEGGRIWALGSTVTRALESQALGMLRESQEHFVGESDLFIQPGFEYQVVDLLMTNFHQPESTLLAMVMAFAGEDTTKNCYQWAIERNFRLFSYGDLSVWQR